MSISETFVDRPTQTQEVVCLSCVHSVHVSFHVCGTPCVYMLLTYAYVLCAHICEHGCAHTSLPFTCVVCNEREEEMSEYKLGTKQKSRPPYWKIGSSRDPWDKEVCPRG